MPASPAAGPPPRPQPRVPARRDFAPPREIAHRPVLCRHLRHKPGQLARV